MCRSDNLIFYHKDLNPDHFSDNLKKKENRSIGP